MVDLFYTCNDLGRLELPPDNMTVQECPMSDSGTIAAYWSRTLPVLLICVVIEVVLLGLVAVQNACAIAAEYGYRLVPLNPERLFVADALICTCFEMGNPKSPLVGVDPATQPTLRRRLGIALMGALLAGKIVFLGQLIKLIVRAVLPISYETWAVSYTAVIASCFWNTVVCRMIMEQVTLIAAGDRHGTRGVQRDRGEDSPPKGRGDGLRQSNRRGHRHTGSDDADDGAVVAPRYPVLRNITSNLPLA